MTWIASPLRALHITSLFGPRGPVTLPDGKVLAAHFHAGLDLRAAIGTEAFAVRKTTIESIARNAAGALTLIGRLDTGERVKYGHLSDTGPFRAGDILEAGDLIALTGDSGGVAPHLHFEVRAKGATSATDPRPFLRAPGFPPLTGQGTTPSKTTGGGGSGLVGLAIVAAIAKAIL